MAVSVESLPEYLVDYDNCKDVEEVLVSSGPKKAIWTDFILETTHWGKLMDLLFVSEKEPLQVFFDSLNEVQRGVYFNLAIECMMHFIQANFTGPDLPESIEEFFNGEMFSNVCFQKCLSVNNEDVNVNVKHPILLHTATLIFKFCDFNPVLNLWWQWRATMVHQHVLEELSPVLLSQADRLQKEINNLELPPDLKAKLEIEQAQLYHIFRNITKSEVHLDGAQEVIGLRYELKGMLGKRTKHQQEAIAQLHLEISLSEDKTLQRPPVNEFDVPKVVALDDDVRLDKIQFKVPQHEKDISDLEQKFLLGVVQEMLIAKPQDNLLFEEVGAFFDILLRQKNTWSVRFMLLCIRCKLEAQHKRTVERSLVQCEEIVNCIKKETPHPLNRVGGIFATNLQPIWKTEAQLAELMLNLGLVKSALDIYLRLQLWEEVIVCYTILNQLHKATEVIKQQLDANPTVKLWCLLGDATADVSCYEKAWLLSQKRSSRVQRHWGHFFYSRKKYQECIPHFEKSVSINPLQAEVWLSYGYAALEMKNWQTAATAYRRYTTLEDSNFEAWNNLAKAYIKLGNKRGAHQALHDALKCNYDNWKVWDNLMAVSADLANFSDVIHSYHRILDLKEKHLDVEVLSALVYGVCNNVNDSEGRPANTLMQQTRELLGRITSVYPTEGHVWELYASVAPVLLLRGQRLQRALRGFMQSGWEKDPLKCQQVLYVCHKLAEVVLSEQIEPTDLLINSVRIGLNSAVSAVRKQNFEETHSLLKQVVPLQLQILEKSKSVVVKTVTEK